NKKSSACREGVRRGGGELFFFFGLFPSQKRTRSRRRATPAALSSPDRTAALCEPAHGRPRLLSAAPAGTTPSKLLTTPSAFRPDGRQVIMMTAPDAAGGGEFASRDPIIERGTQSPGENDDDGNGPGGGRGGGGGGGVGTGVEAARGGGGGGFPLEVEDLVRLMDFTRTPPEKVIETLASWGGVPGTCKALAVDPQHGLRDSEILAEQCERRTRYGVNQMPPLILPTLLEHAWEALHDVTLICLLVAAAVSLGFGLYVDASSHGEEPDVHWVEGFAIFLAVFIIVSITAVNNYKKDGLVRERKLRAPLRAHAGGRARAPATLPRFIPPSPPRHHRPKGAAIHIRVRVTRASSSPTSYLPQAAEAENVRSAVRRNGDSTDIPVQEILVGDVVLLKDGDIVPVDGLVIESHNGKCDESSATGESDAIKKKRFEADENGPGARGGAGGGHAVGGKPPRPGAGPATLSVDLEEGPLDFTPVVKGKSSSTPYLVQSGTKVNEGTVTVVALCVGVNSRYGLLLKEVKKEVEDTPLQKALARLAASIGWFGLGAALLQLLILTIKLVVKGVEGGWSADMNWGASTASGEPQDPSLVGKDGLVLAIVNIIIQAVTIIVVAVPEGLPMAVTIALIYGTRKMAQRNNFVRQLAACETMGGATTICT
ncbi:MAG: E1-E2 ATPase-domain-containing protein, partial [Olpidium bornovanus]